MQFGVGILGRGWTTESARAMARENMRPPHPNFTRHAHRYAAKLAAESILDEPWSLPHLAVDQIVHALATCARPIAPSEALAVRIAFLALYPSETWGAKRDVR